MPATNFTLFGMGACNCGGGPGSCTCSPCNIPQANLTLAWVSAFTGPGSTTLTYGGACGTFWTSPCNFLTTAGIANQKATFGCSGGNIVLAVTSYTSNTCITGTTGGCDSGSGKLILSSHTCSPFSFTYTTNPATCPLYGAGINSFTVTYP